MSTSRNSIMPFAARKIVAMAWCVMLMSLLANAATLSLEVTPKFNGAPLLFDSITNIIPSGQRISVTRLDFLLSQMALRRADGTWLEQTNWFAYMSGRENRTQTECPGFIAGQYDRIRFLVGLKPEINHQNIAAFSAGHPLNPEVNGLHWSWMGGYVFCAVEGNWLRNDGKQSGYSYHLATDQQLMTVELPATLDLQDDCELKLALNVDEIFGGSHPIALNDATSSTHSRTNDSLAVQLRKNIEQAFTVEGFKTKAIAVTPTASKQIEIGSNATPYRLQISGFFPRPALPADNPITEEGVALGHRLFFETKLSRNGSQSCSSCHSEALAFTDGKPVSRGAEGAHGTRNAMPLFNLAWKSSFFWDGRADSLREQILQPIQNPIEMHERLDNVVAKLQSDQACANLFAKAFGKSQITADRIARALEQFLLIQVSYDSKFDRVISGAEKFTEQEQHGFELFHTEYDPRRGQNGADCFHCHGGPLFQSQNFANNGLDSTFVDMGRYAVTKREGDQGRFAVPSLRNVELTAPYMHDGRFATLEDAVEHYCTGMKRSATLDPNLAKHPDGGLPLSPSDKSALVAFLKTLTDERFRKTADPAIAQTR